MRLFLASYATVEFYDDIKRDMHPYFDAKWVEPKNLHLTWLFLGEQPAATPIISRLQPLKSLPRLPMALQGIGTFGRHHPSHLFLKTSQKVAQTIHERIASMLEVEPDDPFRAHVTLARIKRFRSYGFKHIQRPWMSEPLGEVEATIYLIESRLTPSGPIYIPIEEF